MGKRKRLVAEARKEANKSSYFAKLNSCPTSPRKMRQVADLVRGMEVFKALSVLKFNTRANRKARMILNGSSLILLAGGPMNLICPLFTSCSPFWKSKMR